MAVMPLQARSTILIVDDDDANRAVLRLGCESVGLEVVEAATGISALEKSSTGWFAMILLDLALPDISGLEVCRRLRAQAVVTPIIIVSAFSGPAHVELGLAAGADHYIGKPYRVATLLARVQARAHAGDTGIQLPGQPIARSSGLTTSPPPPHSERVPHGARPAPRNRVFSSPPPSARAPDARP
jgi:DNA-binding response OmpR family regulator